MQCISVLCKIQCLQIPFSQFWDMATVIIHEAISQSFVAVSTYQEGVANLPKLHCQQVHLGIYCVHMYVFSISYHQQWHTPILCSYPRSHVFMGVARIVAHGILQSGKPLCSFAASLKF